MQEQTNKPDSQARDWAFVVNNPTLNEQQMFDYLKSLVNVRYFVFVREKGDGSPTKPFGTEHHQGYIEFSKPKKFSTMKGCFSADKIGVNAHISPRKYSRQSCVDYVKKEGVHADKAHTQIGQVYEYGTQPQQGKRNDLAIDLVEMVEMKKQGFSDTEIFEAFPHSHARFHNYVDKISMAYKMNTYKKKRRKLEVVYIYGKTGAGKTTYVMDKYGDENVFRLTDYGPTGDPIFDNYNGQDVIVFEEFRSGIRIEKMLIYLDQFSTTLHARYNDKVACYTKVYFLTNISPFEQYPNIREEHFETWRAFIRRFNKIYNFDISKTEPLKKLETPHTEFTCKSKYHVIIFDESYGTYYPYTGEEYEDKFQGIIGGSELPRLEKNKPP